MQLPYTYESKYIFATVRKKTSLTHPNQAPLRQRYIRFAALLFSGHNQKILKMSAKNNRFIKSISTIWKIHQEHRYQWDINTLVSAKSKLIQIEDSLDFISLTISWSALWNKPLKLPECIPYRNIEKEKFVKAETDCSIFSVHQKDIRILSVPTSLFVWISLFLSLSVSRSWTPKKIGG